MADEEQLLTVPEVAQRFRVSPQTVLRWLRQGRLHGFLLGGQKAGYRIPRSDVDRFLRERSEGTQERAS